MKRYRILIGLGFGLILFMNLVSESKPILQYKIIINTSNPISEISREKLSKIFLKKIKRWEDGKEIHPVDLIHESPIRRRFSKEVHERSVSKVKAYWQLQLFSGRDIPPPQLDYEKDVMVYVNADPGAIGYLSGKTPIKGHSVKVIHVTE
jgi:ABC-type phosphate transport system substrate-binding protein